MGPMGDVVVESIHVCPERERDIVIIRWGHSSLMVTSDHMLIVEGSDGQMQPEAAGQMLCGVPRRVLVDNKGFQQVEASTLPQCTAVVRIVFQNGGIAFATSLPADFFAAAGAVRRFSSSFAPQEVPIKNTFIDCAEAVPRECRAVSCPPRLDSPNPGSVGHPHDCGGACRNFGEGRCKFGSGCRNCHVPGCDRKPPRPFRHFPRDRPRASRALANLAMPQHLQSGRL